MELLNRPSFNDVCVVCCAPRLSALQKRLISCVFRGVTFQVGGVSLFKTVPLLIRFSSWFSIPLMATKVFNTSSAAHMKGPSHQKELVNSCTHTCPSPLARTRQYRPLSSRSSATKRQKDPRAALRRLCVPCQVSVNLCYDANNAASAVHMGQNRQTQTGMFMHYYQGFTCSWFLDLMFILFYFLPLSFSHSHSVSPLVPLIRYSQEVDGVSLKLILVLKSSPSMNVDCYCSVSSLPLTGMFCQTLIWAH